MRLSIKGDRTSDAFHAAANPPIDCFYVYPTVSAQEIDYARPVHERAVDSVIHDQAARLAAQCRVYAPLYRQLTGPGLSRALHSGHGLANSFDLPYADVVSAWRSYLARDNQGRGVVLIGHSQGSILLEKLLAQEIEGAPAHALLVSALLAGDPEMLVPEGAVVGGTFKSTPVCRSKDQVGCAMAWSTYAADAADDPARRSFARDISRDGTSLRAVCVNPAAVGGGVAPLHPVLPALQSGAQAGEAVAAGGGFIEFDGEATGVCKTDDHGTILEVTVAQGPAGEPLRKRLQRNALPVSWGLHGFDVALLEGDIAALLQAESHAWMTKHPATSGAK